MNWVSILLTNQRIIPKSLIFHVHFSYNLTLIITIYIYIEISFNKIILSKIETSNFIEMLFEIANLILQ